MFNAIVLDGAGPISERPAVGAKGLKHGYHWMDTDGNITMYTGVQWVPTALNGANKVALPQNSFGTLSVGEIAGTNIEASTIFNFPNGLNGVTVSNFLDNVALAAGADTNNALVYVAFNNTIFNDATVPGLRYVIGPNSSMVFAFENTPKPTQMTIRIDSIFYTAFFTAAEA